MVNIILTIAVLAVVTYLAIELIRVKKIMRSEAAAEEQKALKDEEWKKEVRESFISKKDMELYQRNSEQKADNIEKNILQGIKHSTEVQGERSTAQTEGINKNFQMLQTGVNNQMKQMQTSIGQLETSNSRNITELKKSVDTGMKDLKTETHTQLQEIKGTVDKQLQDTLDRKLKQSFDSVVKELTNVTKGLGEMSALAGSVGDLKKTLTNVKTRGILGEMQLGAILEQILAPEQYETNVVTVSGTKNPVEFAIKLPGDGNAPVWLPIDSKFPADTYNNLLDAYETGDMFNIEACGKLLESRILQEAKDINSKYVHVPETTEFAIMFLPTEGLYAEVLRRGMLEKLQNKYKVMIAGPTTMAALLNSLYMGFRTIAVSERANEVMGLLGNIKTEFNNYQSAVNSVSKRLTQTSDEFERLVGVRTRQITKQLNKIDSSALAIEGGKKAIIDIPAFEDIDFENADEDIELPFN